MCFYEEEEREDADAAVEEDELKSEQWMQEMQEPMQLDLCGQGCG